MKQSITKKLLTVGIFTALLTTFPGGLHSSAAVGIATTGASTGGFDGYADGYGVLMPEAATLNVGNLSDGTNGGAFARSAALLMFDIANLNLSSSTITSATLTFDVTGAFGTPNVGIDHGTKTTEDLTGVNDLTLTSATFPTYLGVFQANAVGVGVVTVDVTSSILADIAAGNTYSSFRLVQPDTYDTQIATNPFGLYVASAENTGGLLTPTLTIITADIPEPSVVCLMLAGLVMLGGLRWAKKASSDNAI